MSAPLVVSLSGGKDSTAMLRMGIERGLPIHSAVYCDMGPWEFPQMHEHIERLEHDIAPVPLVRVKPRFDPVYQMIEKPVVDRKTGGTYRIGNNWPSPMRRWCTREKSNAIQRYLKTIPGAVSAIGIAVDESHRMQSKEMVRRGIKAIYPLVEWGLSEADALAYCRSLGYDWGGLYDNFRRVSCFCCHLQGLSELRRLRHHFAALWAQMLEWDARQDVRHGVGFKGYATVRDLDARFREEDRQLRLPGVAA